MRHRDPNRTAGDCLDQMLLARRALSGLVGGWRNLEWETHDLVADEGIQTESQDPAEHWQPLPQQEAYLLDGRDLERLLDFLRTDDFRPASAGRPGPPGGPSRPAARPGGADTKPKTEQTQ